MNYPGRDAEPSTSRRRLRVGIDVGGTFTDVVVVDQETYEVIHQLKVPTTHKAEEGVARGIVEAVQRALADLHIEPHEVTFIAHSTTQATNALLEGDVARVGILGMGFGLEAAKARRDTRIKSLELAPGRFLRTCHRFHDSGKSFTSDAVLVKLRELQAEGATVIVAAEAFSVDNPAHERAVLELAAQHRLMATASHEVSQLYGLKVRTRTAALNASVLPRMMETADMTERCVRGAGIQAPLMIMRSDGGVMGIGEVRRRPILTLLSGPAAGIAGALMYEKVSDGIFIEVGGTSADISVIRDGKPMLKSAVVGGHRMYLNTLDVRTIGVAGGSLVKIKLRSRSPVLDVGPRSAHIAGLAYSAFADPDRLVGARLARVRIAADELDEFAVLECPDGTRLAVTPTCAANALGFVSEGDYAFVRPAAAQRALACLGAELDLSMEAAAERVLTTAIEKVGRVVNGLIEEYQLDKDLLVLIGGGGGAASILPYLSQKSGIPYRIAKKAEVISTIGVALAMVRDVVERHIINPDREQLVRLRKQAEQSVIALGAVPESVEVQMEIDRQKHMVRATAAGTTELRARSLAQKPLSLEDCLQTAARSLRVDPCEIRCVAETEHYYLFYSRRTEKKWLGLRQSPAGGTRVVDKEGVIRLQKGPSQIYRGVAGAVAADLEEILHQTAAFGDAGRVLPEVYLIYGRRIARFVGLSQIDQATALAALELEGTPADETIHIIVSERA